MYSDFGSKITLIEISDYFLPKEEEIIVETIKKHFENKKINLITSAKIIKINSLKWNFNWNWNKKLVLKAIVDKDTDLILGAHLLVEEFFEIINIIKRQWIIKLNTHT